MASERSVRKATARPREQFSLRKACCSLWSLSRAAQHGALTPYRSSIGKCHSRGSRARKDHGCCAKPWSNRLTRERAASFVAFVVLDLLGHRVFKKKKPPRPKLSNTKQGRHGPKASRAADHRPFPKISARPHLLTTVDKQTQSYFYNTRSRMRQDEKPAGYLRCTSCQTQLASRR